MKAWETAAAPVPGDSDGTGCMGKSEAVPEAIRSLVGVAQAGWSELGPRTLGDSSFKPAGQTGGKWRSPFHLSQGGWLLPTAPAQTGLGEAGYWCVNQHRAAG